MTELNQEPNPSLEADVAWPALPSQHFSVEGHEAQAQQPQGHESPGAEAPTQDPAISAVLDRLAAVRLTPVSGHGELYAGMHDALLEALNEDVASHAGLALRIHAAGDGES